MAAAMERVLLRTCLLVRSTRSISRTSQRCIYIQKTHLQKEQPKEQQFDIKMLECLVCPLSKSPLRYDKENEELISDHLQVAFPIINGIPNLLPQDARNMNDTSQQEDS